MFALIRQSKSLVGLWVNPITSFKIFGDDDDGESLTDDDGDDGDNDTYDNSLIVYYKILLII